MAARCLWLLLIATAARSLDYVISLRHWDMADGLSHRQVNSGIRDRQGFLWLATPNGLCRFDGLSFKVYNADNAGLPFNSQPVVIYASLEKNKDPSPGPATNLRRD